MIARNESTGLTLGELLDFIKRHMENPDPDENFLTRETPVDCGSGYGPESPATGMTMGMSSGRVRLIVAYDDGKDHSALNVGGED